MELDIRSDVSFPSSNSLETMANNIAMLNKKIHIRIVSIIRTEVGSTQGPNAKQCYLKLKSIINKIPFHSRLEESSSPSVFPDILMLDSVNWLAPIRLQEIFQDERFIKEMESDNYRVHVISSNDNNVH